MKEKVGQNSISLTNTSPSVSAGGRHSPSRCMSDMGIVRTEGFPIRQPAGTQTRPGKRRLMVYAAAGSAIDPLPMIPPSDIAWMSRNLTKKKNNIVNALE